MIPPVLREAMSGLGHVYPEQTLIVERLVEHLDEVLAPHVQLWDCCRHGERCWRRAAQTPSIMHYRVPYVGPRYPTRRIALVGMNSRDDGRIDAEFRTTTEVIGAFRRGSRDWGGPFHFRAASAVSMLAAAQDGRELAERLPPPRVVDDLLGSARLQAVQCAPGPEDSRRSPTSKMWRNCPSFLLAGQLEILEPRVIALLGVATHRSFQRLGPLEVEWNSPWRQNGNAFARGFARIGPRRIPVFALSHPAAAGRWTASLRTLRDSLEATPLDS